MSKKTRIIQVVLLLALVAAGVNFYLNTRDRRITFVTPEKKEVALDPDYYVTPKKMHPQDLKDAKELTQQPVWVREGYRYAYYPYGPPADFRRQAGTLPSDREAGDQGCGGAAFAGCLGPTGNGGVRERRQAVSVSYRS